MALKVLCVKLYLSLLAYLLARELSRPKAGQGSGIANVIVDR